MAIRRWRSGRVNNPVASGNVGAEAEAAAAPTVFERAAANTPAEATVTREIVPVRVAPSTIPIEFTVSPARI